MIFDLESAAHSTCVTLICVCGDRLTDAGMPPPDPQIRRSLARRFDFNSEVARQGRDSAARRASVVCTVGYQRQNKSLGTTPTGAGVVPSIARTELSEARAAER